MPMSIGMSLHCNPHMAEIELNVMIGQCLNRRIGCLVEVETAVSAGQTYRDNFEAKIAGQFTTQQAGIKLRRLYPTLEA